MVRKLLPILLGLAGFMLTGCGDYGKVEQGTTIAFDKDKGAVTIIVDTNLELKKPAVYNDPVPHVFTLPPEGSVDRGANPTPGLCMNLDIEKKIITMYNPKEKKFENIPFELVEDFKSGIRVNRRQEVLRDEKLVKKADEFPVINEEKNTIQFFYRRLWGNQARLTTVKVSPGDFAKYKGKEWGQGDEVRYYFVKPGVAERFMNITKTDITRR